MGLPVPLKAKRVLGIALVELPRDRFSYDTMPRCAWQKRPVCMCCLMQTRLLPPMLLLGPVVSAMEANCRPEALFPNPKAFAMRAQACQCPCPMLRAYYCGHRAE